MQTATRTLLGCNYYDPDAQNKIQRRAELEKRMEADQRQWDATPPTERAVALMQVFMSCAEEGMNQEQAKAYVAEAVRDAIKVTVANLTKDQTEIISNVSSMKTQLTKDAYSILNQRKG